jgi:hypothetical protein
VRCEIELLGRDERLQFAFQLPFLALPGKSQIKMKWGLFFRVLLTKWCNGIQYKMAVFLYPFQV